MENVNQNNLNDFEQLRSEYELLKRKLDSQQIVNEKLLRQAMRAKVHGIDNITLVSSIAGVLVILVSPVVFHYNPVINASWWFVAGTVVMMLACIFFNWKYNHKVSSTDLASCDLLEFARNVKELRRHWKGWIKYAVVMIIVWAGWLIAEIFLHTENRTAAMELCIGLCAGLMIGAILGLLMNRKVVHNCDDILDQVEK